jgi:hypothetical protein
VSAAAVLSLALTVTMLPPPAQSTDPM